MSNPLHGRPLAQRFRLGPVELDRYLAERLGGLSYMRRLRAIEDEEARQCVFSTMRGARSPSRKG